VGPGCRRGQVYWTGCAARGAAWPCGPNVAIQVDRTFGNLSLLCSFSVNHKNPRFLSFMTTSKKKHN
jgi:hypothetical protein